MSEHATHKLGAYQQDRIWIAFCRVCSREGNLLAEPCPGKYVSSLQKEVDKDKERN